MSTTQERLRMDFQRCRARDCEQFVGELSEGTRVRLCEYDLLASLLRKITPRVFDLLRVGLAVYTVDRIVPRKWGQGIGGMRRLNIEIAVADPEFWQDPHVSDLLEEILGLLGTDVWDFRFRQSQGGDEPLFFSQGPRAGPGPQVCLYSGGPDSAAGLAMRLHEFRKQAVPVTVYHQAGQRDRVLEQCRVLHRKYNTDVSPVVVRTAFESGAAPPFKSQERTQRCRSFLFAALAAVVAFAENASEIEVYENGVGAVNLPLMRGMATGARTTRSSHPGFLRLMGHLVSLTASRQIGFTLPHRNRTKAEIVRGLAEDGLSDLAVSTVSCVHFPVRGAAKQCSYCPACLGRRQALLSAGIREPSQTYELDLFPESETLEGTHKCNLDFLKATLLQVDRLAELRLEPLPEWFRQYVLGTQVETEASKLREWADVLLRYRAEWCELIARGQSAGWRWASWAGCDDAA